MLWRTDAQILQSRGISGVQLCSTQVYGQVYKSQCEGREIGILGRKE